MSSPRARLWRAASVALVSIVAATFSGCASFTRIAHYPAPAENKSVQIASKPMSKMSELPIGAHYDPERHIIVTGHQKGLVPGMMFGLVGVIVADQMNKSAGATKYGAEAAKGADLNSILNDLLVASISDGRAQHWAEAQGAAGLQLTPYAVFTVSKTGEARLYAMIRAELPGAGDKPAWSARYFARAPGAHPLQENGWMSGDLFRDGMRVALARALDACVDDTHGRLTGTRKITAKGQFAFINIDFELRGIVVRERGDELVTKLAVGDAMVLAGTHVLDRADYEIKPAEFKDPRE